MGLKFEIKKKITVNGKEYDSLDQVPAELRDKLRNALKSGTAPKTTIVINGTTYGSADELPTTVRAIVGGVTSLALDRMAEAAGDTPEAPGSPDPAADAVRPEPVLFLGKVVLAVGIAAFLFWIARLVL